jgi:hypothetical protein
MAQSRPVPAGAFRLNGVGAAWRSGSPGQRRTLLGTLFERIYVTEGSAVKFVARREHRDEIEELVAAAIGGEEDVPAPRLAAINGVRVREGRCGKGGIRTLEGALAPYPLSRRALSTTQPPPRSEGT